MSAGPITDAHREALRREAEAFRITAGRICGALAVLCLSIVASALWPGQWWTA